VTAARGSIGSFQLCLRVDCHPFCQCLTKPHRISGTADANPQGTVRLPALNNHCGVRDKPNLFQLTQSCRIGIFNAAHAAGSLGRPLCQQCLWPRRYRSIAFRNDMPMRIEFRIPEYGRDPLLKLLRNEVLQPLCLFMNFIPGILEDIMKE